MGVDPTRGLDVRAGDGETTGAAAGKTSGVGCADATAGVTAVVREGTGDGGAGVGAAEPAVVAMLSTVMNAGAVAATAGVGPGTGASVALVPGVAVAWGVGNAEAVAVRVGDAVAVAVRVGDGVAAGLLTTGSAPASPVRVTNSADTHPRPLPDGISICHQLAATFRPTAVAVSPLANRPRRTYSVPGPERMRTVTLARTRGPSAVGEADGETVGDPSGKAASVDAGGIVASAGGSPLSS